MLINQRNTTWRNVLFDACLFESRLKARAQAPTRSRLSLVGDSVRSVPQSVVGLNGMEQEERSEIYTINQILEKQKINIL